MTPIQGLLNFRFAWNLTPTAAEDRSQLEMLLGHLFLQNTRVIVTSFLKACGGSCLDFDEAMVAEALDLYCIGLWRVGNDGYKRASCAEEECAIFRHVRLAPLSEYVRAPVVEKYLLRFAAPGREPPAMCDDKVIADLREKHRAEAIVLDLVIRFDDVLHAYYLYKGRGDARALVKSLRTNYRALWSYLKPFPNFGMLFTVELRNELDATLKEFEGRDLSQIPDHSRPAPPPVEQQELPFTD